MAARGLLRPLHWLPTVDLSTGIDDITSGSAVWPLPSNLDIQQQPTISGMQRLTGAASISACRTRSSLPRAWSAQSPTSRRGSEAPVLPWELGAPQLSATNRYAYRTSYELDWWGDVMKYALDPATGALPIDANGNPLNAPLWTAAAQVDAQAAGTGWDAIGEF